MNNVTIKKIQRPELNEYYIKLLETIILLCQRYMPKENGRCYHYCESTGEYAMDLLKQYGLIKDEDENSFVIDNDKFLEIKRKVFEHYE